MAAYYNEIDPFAAEWLRNLIAAGHIAPGDVDTRSIVDVRPDDLRGYTQCHFFAGIGGWSLALRLAGWPDDEPVWTGSCPCQPLSSAGLRKGHADERHLWPAFHGLISECAPATVFGEQVASADGREWLSAVRADLEALGYAVGAADLCAAGAGATNIRQRLFWLADADKHGCHPLPGGRRSAAEHHAEPCRKLGSMGDSCGAGLPPRQRETVLGTGRREEGRAAQQSGGASGGLDNAASTRHDGEVEGAEGDSRDEARMRLLGQGCGEDRPGRPSPTDGFWRDADWLFCRDSKWRPVEPGTFPLAHGVSGRVGRLRAYGNAINPYPAAEFIGAYRDVKEAA
jgi:DNA (cytosine-5)-methyltransferase 1